MPSEIIVDSLLCTYSMECQNNVEFSQVYNEVLYILLENYPQLIIDRLSLMEKDRAFEIIRIIESPISDAVDLDKVEQSVLINGFSGYIKEQVLASLKTAKSKY